MRYAARWSAVTVATLIDVVAHFFDQLRHKVRTDGLVSAAFDLDARRAEIPGVAADASESFAVIARELAGRRVSGPNLSERQIRRVIYG